MASLALLSSTEAHEACMVCSSDCMCGPDGLESKGRSLCGCAQGHAER